MLNLGTVMLALRDLDGAMEMARKVQEAQPREAAGHSLQGDVLLAKQQPREALAAYEAALERSRNPTQVLRLYTAYQQAEESGKADRLVRAWLAEHPADVAVRVALATALLKAGSPDLAAAEFEHALEHQPDDGILLNNLAWLRAEAGDPRAFELAERAYKLLPEHPSILDTYGKLLVDRGDLTRGVPLLEKAVGLAPDNASIRFHLATALARNGQAEPARQQLRAILHSKQDALDPKVVQRALDNLN